MVQIRLGWHDAGTYDKNIAEWPKRGGANGSLRFEVELGHGANAGIYLTISVFCCSINLSSYKLLIQDLLMHLNFSSLSRKNTLA